jgi:hypothetical protein
MVEQRNAISNQPEQAHFCGVQCVSWSAIMAGALVGLGLNFLLNLFGIAIGLSAFTTTHQGMMTLAVGGLIGLSVGTVAVMFFTGWVAGYLGRTCCFNQHCGALYGFIAWSLSLLLTIVLAVHIGQFMSMRSHSLSHPTSAIIVDTTYDDAAELSEESPNNIDFSTNATQIAANNMEKAANNLGKSLFITFILFFLGAISSCFGGYCGMKPKNDLRGVTQRSLNSKRKSVL